MLAKTLALVGWITAEPGMAAAIGIAVLAHAVVIGFVLYIAADSARRAWRRRQVAKELAAVESTAYREHRRSREKGVA